MYKSIVVYSQNNEYIYPKSMLQKCYFTVNIILKIISCEDNNSKQKFEVLIYPVG